MLTGRLRWLNAHPIIPVIPATTGRPCFSDRLLGLKGPSEAADREPPLSDRQKIECAHDLLYILHGSEGEGPRPARRPAVGYRDGSMDALNRICGDPKALDRLLNSLNRRCSIITT